MLIKLTMACVLGIIALGLSLPEGETKSVFVLASILLGLWLLVGCVEAFIAISSVLGKRRAALRKFLNQRVYR